MQPISKLNNQLQEPKRIVITTHQNPDADALGSSLGLQMYLQQLGHTVTVVSATSFPGFLNWMQGANKIVLYENHPKDVENILANSDILFCLDFNIITRTFNLAPVLEKYKGIKVIMDHHLQPDEAYFDYGISTPGKSSTCEMVYDYIAEQNNVNLITAPIASCLYAGTMTDTGGFRFDGTTEHTHSMISMLVNKGAHPNTIATAVFDNYNINRLQLLGHLLNNNLKFYPKYNAAVIYLTEVEAAKFNVNQGDTEGIVNYPLNIKDISFSTFIHQKNGEVRMSFRSKGDVNVNLFARTYFSGGGHKNASGGRSSLNIPETIVEIEKGLAQFFGQQKN